MERLSLLRWCCADAELQLPYWSGRILLDSSNSLSCRPPCLYTHTHPHTSKLYRAERSLLLTFATKSTENRKNKVHFWIREWVTHKYWFRTRQFRVAVDSLMIKEQLRARCVVTQWRRMYVYWSAAQFWLQVDEMVNWFITLTHAAGNVVMENEDAESSSNSTPRYRPDGIEALCTATGQLTTLFKLKSIESNWKD